MDGINWLWETQRTIATKHTKRQNMNLNDFELEFREKCKLESVIIKKFEYNPDKKLLKIELKYDFGSMPIPNKFEIERIDFPNQFVIGTIQKKNFKQCIDTFHV